MRCHADNGKFASRISPRLGDAMTMITAGATSPTAAGSIAAAAAPAAERAVVAPPAAPATWIYAPTSPTCATRWKQVIGRRWYDALPCWPTQNQLANQGKSS